MKIFCPECSTSYDLPVNLLAAGRRMRCANCGHIWMQEPVQETSPFGRGQQTYEAPADIDPIPASVQPGDLAMAPEEAEPAGPGFFHDVNWRMLGRMVGGFVLGWLVVCALVFGMLAMGKLPNALKPLALAMGFNAGATMAGLEVQNVAAVTHDKTTIVTGKIVNTAAKTRVIPMVELTPVLTDGSFGAPKQIKPEQDNLKSHEGIDFKADMGVVLDAGAGVRVRLLAN